MLGCFPMSNDKAQPPPLDFWSNRIIWGQNVFAGSPKLSRLSHAHLQINHTYTLKSTQSSYGAVVSPTPSTEAAVGKKPPPSLCKVSNGSFPKRHILNSKLSAAKL